MQLDASEREEAAADPDLRFLAKVPASPENPTGGERV